MDSLTTQLRELKEKVDGLSNRLGIDRKATEVAEMEKTASAPDFWDNPQEAQKFMQRMSKLKNEVEKWQKHTLRVNDALELTELGDDDLQDELTEEANKLIGVTDRMELEAVFSGAYDNEDAILSIHAGAGGTDAQDWAEMLERMYLRWAEQNGHKVEVLDRSEGEEAGIKSVTISVRGGDYPYGYLQSEQGVHRLVRQSPFDSAARRHTAFAKVELWPDIQDDIEIDVNPNDLRIDTFRAGGAGGQHVQKNDTAVRITHEPTGIVVQCQNQRSQTQNRDRAMQILKARLFEMEQRKQEAELAELKGENVDAGWGNQIRSYVLHPYQMVKDLRTSFEMGNPSAVLDGDLNGFMESYLRSQLTKFSESTT
ncbi:MAG: peptide chain release factor 2 [Chloroflexota bacterium]